MAKEGLGLEITELRLGLPGASGFTQAMQKTADKKRVFSEIDQGDHLDKNIGKKSNEEGQPQTMNKNQIVGWPPVCSYRRKSSFNGQESTKMYVKVSMDGAPFLRKIDLTAQKCYSDLEMNLEKLFGCYGIFGEALNDADSSEYIPTYEDKEGDWMLVGDVPWTMFIESCKRLRIMKRTEAKGIGIHPKSSFKGISRDG